MVPRSLLQVDAVWLPLLWGWGAPGLGWAPHGSRQPCSMGGMWRVRCHTGACTAQRGRGGGGHPALLAPVMGHLHRLSRELQEKEKVIESLEAKLQERCESPGSSRPPSESSRSATSTSFVSEGLEPCSDGDAASECSQCHEEPARLTGAWGATAAGRGHAAPLYPVGPCSSRCPSGRGCPCGTMSQCQLSVCAHTAPRAAGGCLGESCHGSTALQSWDWPHMGCPSLQHLRTWLMGTCQGPQCPQGRGVPARLSQSCPDISLSLLSLGLHFDSLSKPVTAPLPALVPGLPPFLPAGPPPPAAPSLLGCCGTHVCSLAEAQQELQVLRRQLGESEHVSQAWGRSCLPCMPCRAAWPPHPL